MLYSEIILHAVLLCAVGAETAGVVVSGPEQGENGFPTYTLNSPYQSRPTAVEVLTPDGMAAGKLYPVLYLLPVNDGIMNQWGSGIVEARRHDLANRHQVICVSPEYDYTPWYGDHPSEPALAQESYLIRAVIPMIEERFPVVKGPTGRALLGFSKSGFGAISIALKNPGFIGSAAAWDAPLTMRSYFPGEDAMVRVFETEANFGRYCIPALVEKHVARLRNGTPSITLVSNANPEDSVSTLHALLEEKEVPHRYAVDSKRDHTWTSGWLPVVTDPAILGGHDGNGRSRIDLAPPPCPRHARWAIQLCLPCPLRPPCGV